MALDVTGLLDEAVSQVMRTGQFDRVNQHEPKVAPGGGITAAVWVDRMEPVPGSGLAATTLRLVLLVRLYTSMLAEPQDAIDPNLLTATAVLMQAYTGDFDLGGRVREVDLLGQFGAALSAQAGYVTQDSRIYRVMTVTLPLIVNDAWDQVA